MKKGVALIVVMLITLTKLQAQFLKNKALYLTQELEIGNHLGGGINATYIHTNNYSLSVGFSKYLKGAENIPADYSYLGYEGGLFGPLEGINNYQILAGKIFKFKKSGKTRLNLLAGFSYVDLTELVNWERRHQHSNDGKYSYDYEHHRHGTIGFVINPKIEFPFTKVFGLSVSPKLNISKSRTLFGVGLGIMLGKTRNDY